MAVSIVALQREWKRSHVHTKTDRHVNEAHSILSVWRMNEATIRSPMISHPPFISASFFCIGQQTFFSSLSSRSLQALLSDFLTDFLTFFTVFPPPPPLEPLSAFVVVLRTSTCKGTCCIPWCV